MEKTINKVPEKTRTKGNVIVQEIEVGDIHYEYEYGTGIKSEVISKPEWDGNGWAWESKRTTNGDIINYYISHGHSHYGPNLYDYEAYTGMNMI